MKEPNYIIIKNKKFIFFFLSAIIISCSYPEESNSKFQSLPSKSILNEFIIKTKKIENSISIRHNNDYNNDNTERPGKKEKIIIDLNENFNLDFLINFKDDQSSFLKEIDVRTDIYRIAEEYYITPNKELLYTKNLSDKDLNDVLEYNYIRKNIDNIKDEMGSKYDFMFHKDDLNRIYTIVETSFADRIDDKIVDCFLESTGITAGLAFLGGTINMATSLNLVKKIGRKTLGWIGVGIMVAEFTYCMSSAIVSPPIGTDIH